MMSNKFVFVFVLLALSGCVTSPEPGLLPSNTKVDVWPNPASNSVWVHVDNTGATGKVKVFDNKGQLFFQEDVPNGVHQYVVDINKSPEGTYHVAVELDHEVITKEFIKL